VADNLSGVAQYSAFIDGKWILLHYNVKKGSLHLNLQEEKLESGSHRVEIVVKDERGNRATFACSFTR